VSDTPKVPVVPANDPGKWISAIVGGVILGEALWSLIQLLVRDWGVPALTIVLGQGPTQNQSAFLPLPLLVAFIEVCLAGILLAILMAWSGRGSRGRRVRVIVESRAASSPAPAQSYVPPAPVETPAYIPPAAPVAPAPAPLAMPDQVSPKFSAPVATPARVPVVGEARLEPERGSGTAIMAPSAPSADASPSTDRMRPQPSPAPAAQPAPVVPPAPPAKSKKPKKVYYNIVGEPIESDE
jgi:hypothetical protein